MKIFPFILARIGGLPFDILEKLSLSFNEAWDLLVEKQNEVEKQKNTILNLLEKSNENLHCGYVLKNLAFLKSNLQHNKKLKLSGKLKENLTPSEIPFFEKIENEIANLKSLEQALKDAKTNFEVYFVHQLYEKRALLQSSAKNPVILNGLLMSSHVFLNQLEKYSEKDISGFAKKQFQTERTFLKYLSRICAKTSPFSTFSPLSVFKPEQKINFQTGSCFRLNNHLFEFWRNSLNLYPPFYRKLPVSLNPSLKKNGENWVYLINSRNVESIQKMENNDLLDLAFETFQNNKLELVFQNLVSEIHPSVETDLESLEAYFLDLIDFGFLEWRWPFSGLDPFWDEKLTQLLQKFKNDQFLKAFEKDLKAIQAKKKVAETATIDERKQLLKEAFVIANMISDRFLLETQLFDTERVVDFSKMKHFKQTSFSIKPEKIFFEDVSIPFEPKIRQQELEPILVELNELLIGLEALYFNEFQQNLKQFFLENYAATEVVELLPFYEKFYKNHPSLPQKYLHAAAVKRLKWQSEIMKQSEYSDGVLTIDLALIKQLSSKENFNKKQAFHISKGAFFQFFRDGKKLKGFSESTFEGYGKMMGRFLHLFPQEISAALQNWNERLRNGLLWIENCDASIYNPNLHPPLLPYEIRMPGSQNVLPSEKQISVDELAIAYNETDDELKLIHHPSDKIAYIFDLGFEALESRSPLFQLLATFNYKSSSQSTLSEIVNDYFNKKKGGEITFQPRICVGNQLVIQRKRWFMKRENLLFKNQSESEADYFNRINRWIKENEIPPKIFITVRPNEFIQSQDEKGDDYKPQYMDFESPVFVQLFHKLIKRAKFKIKFEEILPYPDHKINDEKLAVEYLIQWEKK